MNKTNPHERRHGFVEKLHPTTCIDGVFYLTEDVNKHDGKTKKAARASIP